MLSVIIFILGFLEVSNSNLKKMLPPAPVVFTDNNPGRSADLLHVGFTNTVTPSSNINQEKNSFITFHQKNSVNHLKTIKKHY